MAAQRRFYCGGRSKEVLLCWPLKGGFTVVLTAAPVFACLSLPARSTRFSFPTRICSSPSAPSCRRFYTVLLTCYSERSTLHYFASCFVVKYLVVCNGVNKDTCVCIYNVTLLRTIPLTPGKVKVTGKKKLKPWHALTIQLLVASAIKSSGKCLREAMN